MATVSTVPADLVSSAAASNASAPDLLRYDSILADACAFNRRLRKGRVDRPNFFDTATQIAQRPAPWLHRSVQARIKTRGAVARVQGPVNDLTKQQPSQTSLGISTTDPEASLTGSVSGEGSCQSSATQNSANNSTTASNGGERRISAGEMQQSQASPSLEDLSGQRYDSYGGRFTEDDDLERSKLKFRRRIMGMGEKSSVVRRYHRRPGVGVCGRVSGGWESSTKTDFWLCKAFNYQRLLLDYFSLSHFICE
ncbi:unnamed protein product [Hydatigera taeniaeformis]|uniref:Requiem_N domain-containing protein n=1 Tax=Hydatigena taeniaeformis TaxID=6205 RepID=A0A0R3WK38_HYDTA|nr:unnamed protein product [Hydatigera taeniaeformis]